MDEIVYFGALVIAGPMVGVEFAVAAFTNPIFGRPPDDAFWQARSDGSRVLGKVMPFWYVGCGSPCWRFRRANPRSPWITAPKSHAFWLIGGRQAILFSCSTEDRWSPRNRLKVRDCPAAHAGGRGYYLYVCAPTCLRRGVCHSRSG